MTNFKVYLSKLIQRKITCISDVDDEGLVMGLSDGDNNGVVTGGGGVGGGGMIGNNRGVGGGMETDSGADEIPRPMGKIRTGADRPDTVLSSQESFQGYYLTNLML